MSEQYASGRDRRAVGVSGTAPEPALPHRRRAARGEGSRLRHELLTAARTLLIEGGVEHTFTMRRVAETAGVSTPSVYLHFPTKDDLLDTLATDLVSDLVERLDDELTIAGEPSLVCRRAGEAYIVFARDAGPTTSWPAAARSTPSNVTAAPRHCAGRTRICRCGSPMRSSSICGSRCSRASLFLLTTRQGFSWQFSTALPSRRWQNGIRSTVRTCAGSSSYPASTSLRPASA